MGTFDWSSSEQLAEAVRGIPEVAAALDELRHRLLDLFEERLVALYVNGSLTMGDFNPEESDLDLLAALSSEVLDQEVSGIRRLHTEFVQAHPSWGDRVEVAYVSTSGLRTFKSRATRVANISPGEPLNVRMAGEDWLIGFYIMREYGVALFGPAPEALFDEISRDEFVSAARRFLEDGLGSPAGSATRGPQRFAVLTMCRSLYALRHGSVTTKSQAAHWAASEFPEWARVIGRALSSKNDDPATETDDRETAGFIRFARGVGRRP